MAKNRIWLRLLLMTNLVSSVGLLTVACNEKKNIDLALINFAPIAFPVVNNQALQPNEINAVENIVRQSVITTVNQKIANTAINRDYRLDNSVFATPIVAKSVDVHVFGTSETVIGDNFVHIDFINPFDLATIQFPVINLPVLDNTYLSSADVVWAKNTIINLVTERLNSIQLPIRLQIGVDYQLDLTPIVAGASLANTVIKMTSQSKLVKNETTLVLNFVNPINFEAIVFPKLTFSVNNSFRVTQNEIQVARSSIINSVKMFVSQIASGLENKVDYQIDLSPLEANANLTDGVNLTIISCSARTIANNQIYCYFVSANDDHD